MNKFNVSQIMQTSPVIPVLVIESLKHAVPLARALVAGGVSVLEVTLRTPIAAQAIAKISAEVEGAIVGAGTVTSTAQYQQIVDHGAQFAISPGITENLLNTASGHEIPYLPGIVTVSELMMGLNAGLQQFKFFPAAVAGGVPALKAIAGPFSEVQFCPTGGIHADNFLDYLKLDNVLCVGGSWLAPPAMVRSGDWQSITKLAQQAVSAAASILNYSLRIKRCHQSLLKKI